MHLTAAGCKLISILSQALPHLLSDKSLPTSARRADLNDLISSKEVECQLSHASGGL